MQPHLTFIGEIHSKLKTLEECPFQENENAPEASIKIFPEFMEGIKDIKPGDEILLLTWLHVADRTVIKCVRRNNYDSPPVGVFSTRSPDRPNPIGIHVVKVVSINNDSIQVEELEVLDGTPLIDIKPVLKNQLNKV